MNGSWRTLLSEFLMRPRQARAAALGLALAATLLAVAFLPATLQGVGERSDGWVWRWADQGAVERRVVLVDIDEASLKALGPWPWPRQRLAELSRGLDRQGAGLRLFDVVLPDPKLGDAAVSDALSGSAGPTVLAQVFSLDPGNTLHTGQLAGALQPAGCPEAASPAYGYLANAALLGARSAGHITPRVDPDGVVRRVPALLCYRGQAYPALVLAGLMQVAGQADVTLRPGQSWLDPAWKLGVGGIEAPLDGQGNLRVPYPLPHGAFMAVSARDVIAQRLPPDLLKGAWVIVGSTAFGVGDAVPTPLGGAESGLYVHAQLLSALLDGRLPYTPRIAAAWPWASGLLAAALLLWGCTRRRGPLLVLPALALGLGGLFFALHAVALLGPHLWVDWVDPALFALFATLALSAVEQARTLIERERVYQNLASYLPEAVAAKVAFQSQSSRVEARRQDVTVLFADLRNFSAFCAARPAEESATVLHVFFATAAEVVAAHGGVVEHMVGDGIMAVWHEGETGEEPAARALEAARALWNRCQAELPDATRFGLEPLDVGIGVESGVALVGTFGPMGRRTHTVMGEPVTVAARLQAMTAELASPVLVGEAAARRLPGAGLVDLGLFLLEGLSHERTIFSLPVPIPEERVHRLNKLTLVR